MVSSLAFALGIGALAETYPLDRIADAQRAFGTKGHVGKIVLLPPS